MLRLLTGLLTLNLAAYPLAGGWSLSLADLELHSPPFLLSLVAWAGVLFVRAERRAASGRGAIVRLRRWLASHPSLVLLSVMTAIALALRLWGTAFGLPVITHPDEPDATGLALRMLRDGRLDPGWFYYPTLYMYLLLPLFALRYVSLRGQGVVGRLRDLADLEPSFYLLARQVSALLGTATVPLVFRLARRTWPGPFGTRGGLVAAAIVAFSFVHARSSHHGVTDALLTLLLTLALTAAMDVLRRGRTRDYLLAGVLTGLAGAAKYSAVAMVPVLLAAHLLGRPWRRWCSWQPLLSLAAVVTGFFVGSPYVLLNWPLFVDHLGFLRTISSTMTDPGARFLHMLGYSFESGFGPLVALAAWGSLAAALWRRERRELLLAIHAIAFIAIVTHSEIRVMPRYWLPALPAIAVLVGGYAARVERWARTSLRLSPVVTGWMLAVTVAGAVAPTARETLAWDRRQSLPDSRARAYEWLVESAEEGTRVWSEIRIRAVPRTVIIEWRPAGGIRSVRQLQRAGADIVLLDDAADVSLPAGSEEAHRRQRLRKRLEFLRSFAGSTQEGNGPPMSAYRVPTSR